MSSYEGEGANAFITTPYQPPEYENSPYGPEDADLVPGFASEQKPKILLMGPRRSGKSSIQNVVFHKMSPNETMFLESTSKITTNDISNPSIVQFKILDFPGQIDFFDPSFNIEKIFSGVGALVFVIDAQDEYIEAVSKLGETFSKVYKINPKLRFEVFIHKVDGLTDDTKNETQREVQYRVKEDLREASVAIPGLDSLHISFYLTSIYDHSIFEAFSKVIQKLIPQLPTLENLINIFNTNSSIEKTFLFDVNSKIYMATDYNPVDMQSYELCCDMLDVVLDISYIYGVDDGLTPTDTLACFDADTYSSIKLDNNTVLLMWRVAPHLALVCIIREENYTRPGLIEYNYHVFQKGLLEILEIRNQQLKREQQEYEKNMSLQHDYEKNMSIQEKTNYSSDVRVDSDVTLPSTAGNDDSNDVTAAIRTLSDGVSTPRGADPRMQARHNSVAVTTNSPDSSIVSLKNGQFIKSGGPDGVLGHTSGTIGNTYVMTDDQGMVLVNGGGASANAAVRS